jgi:hypothetical protein
LYMKALIISLFLICIAAVAIAGCTAGSPRGATPAPTLSPALTGVPAKPFNTLSPAVTGVPAKPEDVQTCTIDQDCMPAQCCHPTSCINRVAKQPCNVLCTMSCDGPIDCGAGRCGCVNGKCGVVPAEH